MFVVIWARLGRACLRWRLVLCAAALLAPACAASKVAPHDVLRTGAVGTPVRTVTFAPSDGMLAYAIGKEMTKRGYVVVDTSEARALLTRVQLDTPSFLIPQGLAALKEGGIEAVISVSSTGARIEGMDSAIVIVTSTSTLGTVGGVVWENGWGGMSGSLADVIMRKGVTEAAAEIARVLAEQLPPAPRK